MASVDRSGPLGAMTSASRVEPVTKGVALSGTCRGLNIGVAGTLNFVDGEGNTRTNYPAQQGYNPILVQAVNAGGTSNDIWALY